MYQLCRLITDLSYYATRWNIATFSHKNRLFSVMIRHADFHDMKGAKEEK